MIINMNLLGIDFEEWYHPELIQRFLTIEKREPKVINGFEKILELLRKTDTLATFFVVGELLEFRPEIVDKIIENGHEIGFHTMHHTRLDSPGFKENFDAEIKKFSELTNGHSKGFRAPTFSLNKKSSWVVDMLANNDYLYALPSAVHSRTVLSADQVRILWPSGLNTALKTASLWPRRTAISLPSAAHSRAVLS